jgi:hypothetical protein
MPKQHQVQPGECVSSIAFDNGFFWPTVWNHKENSRLQSKRGDPNTLCAGDVVFVPDKREKTEIVKTSEEHRFRLRGVPAYFRLQVFDNDAVQANTAFELHVDGIKTTGVTDSRGFLQVPIPPNARFARLLLGPGNEEFEFQLGHLQPITETAGVKARLNNLGFDCGSTDQSMDDETRQALRNFQASAGLSVTGEIDESTRRKLETLHDTVGELPKSADAADDDDAPNSGTS